MTVFLASLLPLSVLSVFFIRRALNWLGTSYKFQLFGKMITCVDTHEKVLALTYDDGPNPPYTDNLLDIFREFDAKATFFTIGKNVEQNIGTARRMVAEGHELGNHSYSHKRMVGTRLDTIRTEIQKTDDILSNLGVCSEGNRSEGVCSEGVCSDSTCSDDTHSDILFRAPFGLKRIRLPWELARRQKTNILWNVDPKDYQSLSSEDIASHVISNIKPGSIVLFHDGGGDRTQTVAATKIIIKQLLQDGYQFKTVTELMALGA